MRREPYKMLGKPDEFVNEERAVPEKTDTMIS